MKSTRTMLFIKMKLGKITMAAQVDTRWGSVTTPRSYDDQAKVLPIFL